MAVSTDIHGTPRRDERSTAERATAVRVFRCSATAVFRPATGRRAGITRRIVGEIQDETDAEQPAAPIVTFEDHWEASGLVSISDVERAIGLTVPDDLDANTLSGLFMQRLGRMPEAGDVILEAGFRLRALTIIGRRVGQIRIDRLPDGANAGEKNPDENPDSVVGTDPTDPRA